MRPAIVVESFPFFEFPVHIHIVSVSQLLIELFFVRAVGSLDFAFELRRSWFDVGMSDAFVLNMPVE
jgi:hypothetical protein